MLLQHAPTERERKYGFIHSLLYSLSRSHEQSRRGESEEHLEQKSLRHRLAGAGADGDDVKSVTSQRLRWVGGVGGRGEDVAGFFRHLACPPAPTRSLSLSRQLARSPLTARCFSRSTFLVITAKPPCWLPTVSTALYTPNDSCLSTVNLPSNILATVSDSSNTRLGF